MMALLKLGIDFSSKPTKNIIEPKILAVFVVDAVESGDFEWAKSKQACTRQACFMKIGAIAISARSDALVAMFA